MTKPPFDQLNIEEVATRTADFIQHFSDMKDMIESPEVAKYLHIDKLKLLLANANYFRDRDHLKDRHSISGRLHRSRVVAYLIKWILHYSPVYYTISPKDFNALPEEYQDLLLNINIYYALHLAFQVVDELQEIVEDFYEGGKLEPVVLGLAHHMQTDEYNAEMASVVFLTLAIIAAGGRPDNDEHDLINAPL